MDQEQAKMQQTPAAAAYQQGGTENAAGKRVGCFFAALGAAAACYVLQLVVGILYMLLAAVIAVAQYKTGNPDAGQRVLDQVAAQAVQNSVSGTVLAYHVVSLPLFGIWYYFGCGRPRLSHSLRQITKKALAIAAAGGFLLCLFSNGIVGLEIYIIPDAVESYIELMEASGMGVDLLAIIASVVLAPIGEEILCRGIILHYARKAFPRFFMANIFQAVLFGVIHGNLIQGIYAFFIALMLGYLAERYRSLLPGMLLHFVVNFSSTFLMEKLFFWVPDVLLSYLVLTVLPVLLLLLLLRWGGSRESS